MQIEFLGTGGYRPSESRHTACILLPEIGVQFDAGTAVFRVPQRLQTRNLDIFLSHAHLDHIAGLTFLLPHMLDGTIERCRLIANARTLETVHEHLFAEAVFPVEPAYEYVELPDQMTVGGNGKLTHVGLQHPGGCIGYRIDWPERSLAYITDTVADGTYHEFVRDVDVLIHECYFPDKQAKLAVRTGHSHTTPVAQLARDMNVKQLFLVHTDPVSAADDPIDVGVARAIFPETYVATDRQIVEF